MGQLLVRELQLLLPYSNDTLGNMIHDDAMIKMIPGECMIFPMSFTNEIAERQMHIFRLNPQSSEHWSLHGHLRNTSGPGERSPWVTIFADLSMT